jgi:multidrug resistance efflux pump
MQVHWEAVDKIRKHIPKVVTLVLVIVAAIAAFQLYRRYSERPWTRDGQVRADVIKVAPRVSGYVVQVAVRDNQQVRKGQLLFAIDPRDYQLDVEHAQVSLDQTREDVEALEAAVRAAEAKVKQSNAGVNSAQGEIDAAEAAIRSAEAAVKEAESGVISARAFIAQIQAKLEEAQSESERARRLADRKAGSLETAEAKAAAVKAYQAQLESANAGSQQAQATLDKAMAAKDEAKARLVIATNGLAEAQAAVVTAIADRDQAQANLGEPGDANVRIRSAQVSLDEAQLKLDWTKVYAPADGYISNLYLKEGAYASAGAPLIALVDSNSFRVHAYFEETKLRHIRPGDPAIVTLMSHPDQRLRGDVESVGRATNPPKVASTEGELGVVPSIEPTFDWVRLAQRVPVTVRLLEVPEGVRLISGTTASISIEK